jgi:hypothetical protein
MAVGCESRAAAPVLGGLAAALAQHGLLLRGAFHPAASDAVPPLPNGAAPRTVALVGNAGPGMWRHFTTAPEFADGEGDSLDRWTRRVLIDIAESLHAAALFPFDGPPYLPIQRWAQRAEPVHQSPLGLLIHPEFGLWHAYRGALAFAARLDLPARADIASPCDSCAERPCLTTCPVGAFTRLGYDVPGCAGHLDTPDGADCMEEGCRARRACPVGRGYRYLPAQAEFHMLPFRRNALARLRREA